MKVLVSIGYISVGVAAVVTTKLVIDMMQQGSFDEVNSLVEFDMSHGGQGGATPSHFLPWVLGALVACYFLSCMGLVGARSGNPSILGLNGCLLTCCLVVFGCTAFTVLAFDETIMPVLVRQTKEFCGPELYPNYDAALGCTDPDTKAKADCGAECQQRLAFLKQVGGGSASGGCSFLDTICRRATYVLVETALQVGECLVGTDQHLRTPELVSTKVADEATCSSVCDADLECSAYGWNTDMSTPPVNTCRVYTLKKSYTEDPWDFSQPPIRANEMWGFAVTPIDGVVADTTGSCYRKGRPQAIEDASQYAKILALACGVLLVVATYTLLVNMMWVYTLNTGHKGKKGLNAIQRRLCCPCLTRVPNRKRLDPEEARLNDPDSD